MWQHIFYYLHDAIYQYKCVIHDVLFCEDLYCHFVCNLPGIQGLIKHSVEVKIQQLPSSLMARSVFFCPGPQAASELIN